MGDQTTPQSSPLTSTCVLRRVIPLPAPHSSHTHTNNYFFRNINTEKSQRGTVGTEAGGFLGLVGGWLEFRFGERAYAEVIGVVQ